MFANSMRLRIAMVVTAVSAGFALPAMAQNTPSAPSNGSNPVPVASATKAQRKAERKQARAKRSTELKKLEGTGYNPSRASPNYPTDVQNAQKKAGASGQ